MYRRKSSAVLLCKSIESAIQWFQVHHGITFITIHNPAVYLSGFEKSEHIIGLDSYILNNLSYLNLIWIYMSHCMTSLLKLEITV